MGTISEERYEEYWDWIAVALFLLITLDLLTTLFATYQVGLQQESNPIMQWALLHDLPTLIGLHLLAAGLIISMFYALLEMLAVTPPAYQSAFARVIEVWLGGLCAVGLFIFANNLTVIFLGQSLL